MTNLSRAFGDDALLLILLASPFALLLVVLRSRRLSGRTGAPYFVAMLEASALTYVLLIASITLTSSGLTGEPRRVDWALVSSDLAYGPERIQVIGNLLLFLPLLFVLVLRCAWLRSAAPALGVAATLPAIVEVLQYLMNNGRAVTVEDWLLGCVGGIVGAGVARLVSVRSRRAAGLVPDAAATGVTRVRTLDLPQLKGIRETVDAVQVAGTTRASRPEK